MLREIYPPFNFKALYPMDAEFSKKGFVPTLDPATILSLDADTTIPTESTPSLKDSMDRRVETLLKTFCALTGAFL